MTVTLTSPAGLLPGAPYYHVATATGARHVYVAGQVAHMPDGAPIPTDPEFVKVNEASGCQAAA